jgi:hypothetical protein
MSITDWIMLVTVLTTGETPMNKQNSRHIGEVRKSTFRRWDFLILPALGLLTVSVLLISSEGIANHYFESDSGIDSCDIHDPAIGFKHRPNCNSKRKAVDGPWVASRYNDCGYRTKESCGTAPLGTTRIALLGSSTSLGLYVGDDETFAAQTARDLTNILKKPVEVQNLGRESCPAKCSFNRIGEALKLNPSLLIIAISPPFDMEHLEDTGNENVGISQESPKLSLLMRAKSFIKDSCAGAALTHFMTLRNPAFSHSRMLLYLQNEGTSGYLKTPFPPTWEGRFDILDKLVALAAFKANNARVPVVMIEIPSLHQLTISRSSDFPLGVSPFAFNERLKQIALRHNIQFVDGLDAFKDEPDANKLYYVVDGHINKAGHSLISRALVDQLMKGEREALLGQKEVLQSGMENKR